MYLSDLLEYIMYGELANLAISANDEGQIKEKDLPKVISNINLGLMDIHKRYPVLTELVNIQLYEHISFYKLSSTYALSNTASSTTYKYIIDSQFKPFKDNIIKILSVINENCDEFRLNVENDCLSLYTPAYNVLQVPYPLDENSLSITYQAYPAKIPLNTQISNQYELDLPEFFIEPLVSFVNAKLFAAIGLEKQESINFMQKYELQMRQIHDLGVYNVDTRDNLKLESNQWV